MTVEKIRSNISSNCESKSLWFYDRWNKFLQSAIENDSKTYDIIKKIKTGQSDDCTTGRLLDYPYFKKLYKLIAIDLRK